MEIDDVARELNRLSRSHPIGQLQELRTRIRNKPSRTHAIFTATTIKNEEDYAFHDGGRHELQFNIGFEPREGRRVLRYGVAFSLEPSQALPDITVLFPKIEKFNYYIRTNPSDFPGFRMWYWLKGQPNPEPEFIPQPFDPVLLRTGNFLFFGDWVYEEEIDLEGVLCALDCLLPLYAFVEGGDYVSIPGDDFSVFRPGHSSGRSSTRASREASVSDVALRHNELKDALYGILVREYGRERVRTEFPVPGGNVDVAVNHPVEHAMDFYEIKVAPLARCALREALGQILEYCYWPNSARASELIVVGESEPNEEARMYLDNLRRRFGLRLAYRRLDMEKDVLGPPV